MSVDRSLERKNSSARNVYLHVNSRPGATRHKRQVTIRIPPRARPRHGPRSGADPIGRDVRPDQRISTPQHTAFSHVVSARTQGTHLASRGPPATDRRQHKRREKDCTSHGGHHLMHLPGCAGPGPAYSSCRTSSTRGGSPPSNSEQVASNARSDPFTMSNTGADCESTVGSARLDQWE